MQSSSNFKSGIGLFQLLPPELRNYIFSYLGRDALTTLRATCSTLEQTVPSNIDRVFISANSRNIQVFRAIADSEKHRHNVTEIIWDDARLAEGPRWPEASDLLDYNDEAYDPVTRNGCPRWFTMRCVDGGVGYQNHNPPDNSMGLEESWDYYKALLKDQRGIMQSNADIETFKYGLQRFTHLKRITITPSTHGRIGQPMFRTPMIRSFPPGFDYPLPSPWPCYMFDDPSEDIPWVSDENRTNADDGFSMSTSEHEEYRSKWRGFRVVTRALVACEQDHHVTELKIGGREMMTGVNCHVFDQRCQEYDDLVSLLKRPGFRRLDLDLRTFFLKRHGVGWKSYQSGLLHDALTQAKDLRHLSLRTTTAIYEGDPSLISVGKDPEKAFPLEIIFPIGQWSNLQHFGISNMLVIQSNLFSVLTTLQQSLRSVELSHLVFAAGGSWWGLLNEMRDKLDWRMRLMEERPTVHVAVATLHERLELGFYTDLDDAVESFLFGSGTNPFNEPSEWPDNELKYFNSVPSGAIGTQRDFFDPYFSAPYEFISSSGGW